VGAAAAHSDAGGARGARGEATAPCDAHEAARRLCPCNAQLQPVALIVRVNPISAFWCRPTAPQTLLWPWPPPPRFIAHAAFDCPSPFFAAPRSFLLPPAPCPRRPRLLPLVPLPRPSPRSTVHLHPFPLPTLFALPPSRPPLRRRPLRRPRPRCPAPAPARGGGAPRGPRWQARRPGRHPRERAGAGRGRGRAPGGCAEAGGQRRCGGAGPACGAAAGAGGVGARRVGGEWLLLPPGADCAARLLLLLLLLLWLRLRLQSICHPTSERPVCGCGGGGRAGLAAACAEMAFPRPLAYMWGVAAGARACGGGCCAHCACAGVWGCTACSTVPEPRPRPPCSAPCGLLIVWGPTRLPGLISPTPRVPPTPAVPSTASSLLSQTRLVPALPLLWYYRRQAAAVPLPLSARHTTTIASPSLRLLPRPTAPLTAPHSSPHPSFSPLLPPPPSRRPRPRPRRARARSTL